ncbi:MAG: class I SAM-dependent methyltransferase [Veillonella sp.]|jgi:methyltransferase domain protein|nr:class I SAM-dependent methyltransferase [Veillonella sp.]
MAQQSLDFAFWNEQWKQGYYNREKSIRANPLIEYWDKRAYDFSVMRKSNDYDFGRKVYAALSGVLNSNSTMLDIGAGPGSFTIPFAQHIKSVMAIEPSKGMVAVLKENTKEAGVENFNVIEELIQDLPQDGSPDFQFDLVAVSLVLWIFPDVWPRILQMEQYSKGYCAIIASIPDWKNLREASKSDVQEFQILYNMLLSQGRSPNVSIIDYRCERTVEDEIECRKIIYEQYYGDLTTDAEEQIKKDIIAKAKEDNKCLISSRAAIIWWNPKEIVSA